MGSMSHVVEARLERLRVDLTEDEIAVALEAFNIPLLQDAARREALLGSARKAVRYAETSGQHGHTDWTSCSRLAPATPGSEGRTPRRWQQTPVVLGTLARMACATCSQDRMDRSPPHAQGLGLGFSVEGLGFGD